MDLIRISKRCRPLAYGGNIVDKQGLHRFAGGKNDVLFWPGPDVIYLFRTVYNFSSAIQSDLLWENFAIYLEHGKIPKKKHYYQAEKRGRVYL